MPLPWFKRQGETLPPELESMEPAQLIEAVNKAKKVDALETELATTKQKLSEVDDVKARLAAIEGNVTPPKREETTGPVSFLEDEDRAFNERHSAAMTPIYAAQVQSAKFQAKASLNIIDRKIWEKYEAEIEEIVKPLAVQYQSFPQTWINGLTTIKGRHFEELNQMASGKSEVFAEEAGSNGSGAPRNNEIDPSVLTDEDKKIAKRFGVSEEDYLKSKKEMVVRAESH